MAVTSPCGLLANGQDAACLTSIDRRYYQQAVVMNRSDVVIDAINVPTAEDPDCVYSATFHLKDGATGYLFAGSENGSVYKGYFDKSVSDLSFPQYIHHVDMLVLGVEAASKCILDSLAKGSYVVAMQIGTTIEIFGLQSGLVVGDYTYDLTEGGGGATIPLSSLEVAPENRLPFVYLSNTPGSEVADFDSLFANTEPSV